MKSPLIAAGMVTSLFVGAWTLGSYTEEKAKQVDMQRMTLCMQNGGKYYESVGDHYVCKREENAR